MIETMHPTATAESVKPTISGVGMAIVHLNDTYSVDERVMSDGTLVQPGFPRVAQLVNQLRDITIKNCGEDRVLVVHSGDFLSPSYIGRYHSTGSHMTELLQQLKCEFYTIGNHEFDYEKDHPGTLAKRLAEMLHVPLICNLKHPTIASKPWAVWPEQRPSVLITGVAGESTAKKARSFGWESSDPSESLWAVYNQVEREFPQVRTAIVLTHMDQDEDWKLLNGVVGSYYSGELFLGGHDHNIRHQERHLYSSVISKNLSNARTVTVYAVTWQNLFPVEIDRVWRKTRETSDVLSQLPSFDLHPALECYLAHFIAKYTGKSVSAPTESETLRALTRDAPLSQARYRLEATDFTGLLPSPPVQQIVDRWMDVAYGDAQAGRTIPIPTNAPSSFSWDATDDSLRTESTDFGNFVADTLLAATGADVAIIHAGSFRCDSRLPRQLDHRWLLDVFLFDSKDALLVGELPAEVVDAMLCHGATKGGQGAFPQVALGRFRIVDGALHGENWSRGALRVVIAAYLLTSDEDGYRKVLSEVSLPSGPFDIDGWVAGAEHHSIIDLIEQNHADVAYDRSIRIRAKRIGGPDGDEYDRLLAAIIQFWEKHSTYSEVYAAICGLRPLFHSYHPADVLRDAIGLKTLFLELLEAHDKGYMIALLGRVAVDPVGFQADDNDGKSAYHECIRALRYVLDQQTAE